MADVYGVASMTAQRALRELQNRRITYAVAGKGTFVHPDAFEPPRIFRRENQLRSFLFGEERGNGDGEAAQVVYS
jgi:DNA-binding GntR family transcriptional regulator